MVPETLDKGVGEKSVKPKRGQRLALVAVVTFLVIAGGVVIWKSS